MNGWPGHGHLASPIPLTVRTTREHPDGWAERDELSARRAPQSASSGDDSPTSPRRLDEGADRPIGNGLLLSPDGRVVRHVDSFVRSTRHRGRGERPDEPIDICEWLLLCLCVWPRRPRVMRCGGRRMRGRAASNEWLTDGRHDPAILRPAADEEGSPRSRRLTFEFRNFNLYPDARD
ncbi:hypothetical protein FRC08_003953, partial [Ceratobasidium sp. 394]